MSLLHEFILDFALVSEKVGKIVYLRNMMSGHGGNPGKFEPCRRFEAAFHNTFLVHPGTKTAACLHGE